jgi:hypothetical protein
MISFCKEFFSVFYKHNQILSELTNFIFVISYQKIHFIHTLLKLLSYLITSSHSGRGYGPVIRQTPE